MRSGRSASIFIFFSLVVLFVTFTNQAHAKTNTTTTLTSSLNPSIYGQSVTLTATVKPVSGSGTPTGTVNFVNGSNTVTKTLSGGVATLTTSTLNVGTYSITATYSGDSNFNTSTSSPLSQVVNKASTTMAVTSMPNPSSFNQSVTFTATVTGQFGGTPGGSVTFTSVSTTLCSGVTLSGAVATCSYAILPVGSNPVTAAFLGSPNYLASSGSETQTVNKAATTTTVTGTPNPSSYKQSVTFTATVTGAFGGTPTGTVTFTSGSTTLCNAVTLTSGVATCAYTGLAAGSDSVTAAYSGDTNYSASSGSESQTVNKATTTTALTSTPNPSSFHQSVTFTATVTGQFGGTPTGTVTFTSGSTTLCNAVTLTSGVATCAYTGLAAGSDSVTAAYSGDTNYSASSGSETQTVNKATTTTALTSTPNPSSFNQSVTFTAMVTGQFGGTPGGTVTFTSGSTTLCSTVTLSGGVATCQYATLPVGSNSVTATFGGSPNFLTSNGSETQTVTKATTTTALTSTPNPSSYRQSVTFTATVTGTFGGTPTGTVTFTSGSTTLCNAVTLSSGVATCVYATLPAGSDSVSASYSGDGNYSASTGSETQTVGKATSTTGLTSTPNPSNFDQSVTFTATVTGQFGGAPTGTVTFTSGTITLCSAVSLSSGVATCVYSTLPSGSDSVTASYSGDTNYSSSVSSPLTQVVIAVLVSISVSPQDVSMASGATQQYSAEGTYNDGSTNNITSSVTWASSAPAVATISSGGLATGVSQASSAMMTTISASSGSVPPGTSSLTVYPANTFFVAPNGSDTWSGHLAAPNSQTSPTDGPLASPAEAVLKVRSANQANNQQVPINVYLRAGTYYLAESPTAPGTLTLNNQYDSGTANAGITWQSYPGDQAPIISGSVPANTGANSWPGTGLNLNWQLKPNAPFGNWYQATLPQTLPISGTPLQDFEYFFYNGERRLRSRVHDTVSPSVGFYMSSTGCTAIPGWPAGEFPTVLSSCNLGSFLRVEGTIAPTDPLGSYNGNTCISSSGTDSQGNAVSKCLDRFYFTPPSGAGSDPIENWTNLNPTAVASQPCVASTAYPPGDVTLTLFDAWTVDAMRVNCVDTTNNVIYLAGATKSGGGGDNYYFFGPTINHRFIIENDYNAFQAAQGLQETGIWFLDRSAGPNGPWVLNYVANSGETPSTADIEIPQLGGTIPGGTATDYFGGSLIYATNLNYVTFHGITFEMDNFYPTTVGFNNDVNGEYPLPQAIDCEGCQFVTFDTVTVQHTSASGILAAATAATPACSSLALPTATNYCVLIQNSGFYDIGDSGIRVGHTPTTNDTSESIVIQDVWAKNNLIEGYSRVFADGEGIAEGNGNYNLFSNNTITDGYHAGISVCFNGCPPAKSSANINGNYITSENNLLSNLMQGITSDGGALYYNVGGPTASGVQGFMTSNVIHDITDSYIIDVVGTTKDNGSGYGGEGLYLDAQTAGVNVSNNVVYNVTGHAIHITEGLGSPSTETANTFNNNILAFANQGMFTQDSPWISSGCPATGTVQQVNVTNNLFYFDLATGHKETGRSAFSVVQGCTDSCIGPFTSSQTYNNYQNFSGNDYWSTAEAFGSDKSAFQIELNQGSSGLSLNGKAYSCTNAGGTVSLSFGTAPSWQSGGTGVPVTMNEDTVASGGEIFNFQPNNPNFPTAGLSTSTPSDFTITNGQGLPANFNPSATNSTITGSGSSVSNPNPACSTFPIEVCPTFPTYVYGSTQLPF